MNAHPKTVVIDPDKLPTGAEFTPELAKRRTIERRQLTRAGEYGWRIRCLSGETGNKRWEDAAARFADDYAIGMGVRGERLGTGERTDYAASAGGYTQVQLDALKRLRQAKAALGPVFAQVMHDIACDGMTASALGRAWKISDKTALQWGVVALENLALWYEGG